MKPQTSNGQSHRRDPKAMSPRNFLKIKRDVMSKNSGNSQEKAEGGSVGNRRRIAPGVGGASKRGLRN